MIQKILVAQPLQAASNPQYTNICNKYSVKIDFKPFFSIEPVSLREFRGQRINILDYSAIVFTAKASIDAFFKLCSQLRIKIPDSQKYFCTTEGVAFYLQKHIVYRKRKIFYGDGSFGSIVKLAKVDKHKNENFLIVSPGHHNPELLKAFDGAKLKYSTSIMANFIDTDLKDINVTDYQIFAFYNAFDVRSLKSNFPKFKQGNAKFIAFGAGTKKALEEAGLEIAITGPTPEFPSMGSAIEKLLKEPEYSQTKKESSKPIATKEVAKDIAKEKSIKVSDTKSSKATAKTKKNEVKSEVAKKSSSKKVVAAKKTTKPTKDATTKAKSVNASDKKSSKTTTKAKKNEVKKSVVKKSTPKKVVAAKKTTKPTKAATTKTKSVKASNKKSSKTTTKAKKSEVKKAVAKKSTHRKAVATKKTAKPTKAATIKAKSVKASNIKSSKTTTKAKKSEVKKAVAKKSSSKKADATKTITKPTKATTTKVKSVKASNIKSSKTTTKASATKAKR